MTLKPSLQLEICMYYAYSDRKQMYVSEYQPHSELRPL